MRWNKKTKKEEKNKNTKDTSSSDDDSDITIRKISTRWVHINYGKLSLKIVMSYTCYIFKDGDMITC